MFTEKFSSMGVIAFDIGHSNEEPTTEEIMRAIERLTSLGPREIEERVEVQDTIERET